jgi:hypothetical protein
MFGGSTISVRRKLLAWWLLVLLVRVLAPEAAVLQLHSHTQQLYQLPFVPAAMASLPAPVRLLAYATYRPQASVCRPAHLLDGACLRGPPALG